MLAVTGVQIFSKKFLSLFCWQATHSYKVVCTLHLQPVLKTTLRKKMKPLNKKNKIIWSVDPTQDPAAAKNIIKELKVWATRLNCDVQPVSIFSLSTLNLPMEISFLWKDKLKEIAKKSMTLYLKKAQAKGFLPPDLVFISAQSSRKMATEMASYAEVENAQLVVANTRAMKTWNPFRLGSFAETLVATSLVPVLLLNPSAVASAKIPSILLPTDFSLTSKNILVTLKPWAKAFKSKIFLYNQVPTPNINLAEFNGIGQSDGLNLQLKEVEKLRLEKGAEWMSFLQSQNIRSSLLVERQQEYLAADILEVARKNKISLIAIANQSGPVKQAFLGSVARDILLHAKCPVLIFYRPKTNRKPVIPAKQKINGKYLTSKNTSIQSEVQHA